MHGPILIQDPGDVTHGRRRHRIRATPDWPRTVNHFGGTTIAKAYALHGTQGAVGTVAHELVADRPTPDRWAAQLLDVGTGNATRLPADFPTYRVAPAVCKHRGPRRTLSH